MGTEWVSIRPDGPFNLAKTLECGQTFRWQPRTHPEIGVHYEGVIFGNVVRVRQVNGEIEFTSSPDSPKDFRPRLEHYLALDYDLERTYASLGSDSSGVMSRLIDKHRGLRIMRQEPWECLASFICTTNIPVDRTTEMIEAVARKFGDRVETDGFNRCTFPQPVILAEAEPDRLRQVFREAHARFPNKLPRRIAEAAAIVHEYGFFLSILHDLPYDLAFALLNKLDGVADKIADCVLLFSCGKYEAFPVDTHVEQGIKRLYPTDTEAAELPKTLIPRRKRLRRWGQKRFGAHAGYASQYIFYDQRKESDACLP